MPCFWTILQFYQQFHWTIYVWRWCKLSFIFFLVISIMLTFQIKKNSMWIFVSLKCQQDFEILLVVWTLKLYKFWIQCHRCLILEQIIVFHTYFMEITALIFIWLQLNRNGSSTLLKNFNKLNFLAILSYQYGFF